MPIDCCFCKDNDWFRYRVGAIIISEGHALFFYGEESGYYYTIGGGVHVGERSEDAVIREVYEETGERFEVERPLCLVENFFKGDDVWLKDLNCHAVEFYYLMKSTKKREYDVESVTTCGAHERMCWLPIDKIDDYDVRPVLAKELVKKLPEHFTSYVNDMR